MESISMSVPPEHFTVWAEIPVTDLDRAIGFYSKVFSVDMKKDATGPNPVAFFPTAQPGGVAGHLYPGKPAPEGTGATVHFASPDKLETALERVTTAGGKVLSDVITIPAGRFSYCLDPDGNSIGVFSK
jgi:uncharacterized protein